MPIIRLIQTALATIQPVVASMPNVDTISTFAIDVPDSLLARARGGELHAFEQIYRLFERPVYTLALRLTGDAETAHDVLHDAMLKVFECFGQFRAESPFWGWLRQIALNEALMRLRKSRRVEVEQEFDEIESEQQPAPWVQADGTVLDRALNRLPEITRSVLWLYHVEGYSHAEIAAAMGNSVSFSKSQVARGTARLRSYLLGAEEISPCLLATSLSG